MTKSRRNYQSAMQAALSNAAYFSRVYRVHLGTDLQWHADAAFHSDEALAFAVVWPNGTVSESRAETTVGELKAQAEDKLS